MNLPLLAAALEDHWSIALCESDIHAGMSLTLLSGILKDPRDDSRAEEGLRLKESVLRS